jgi:hypothetical protein
VSEIQRADPAARRASVLIIACGAVVGVVLIGLAGALRPEFERWLAEDPRPRLEWVMAALSLMASGPLLGLAWYLWRLGHRIRRAGAFPPPGFKVVRDTPVETGQAARRRAVVIQTLAVVLAAGALLMAAALWRLISLLPA